MDEVIVVNNNAAPGTSEEVAGTGAREIFDRMLADGRSKSALAQFHLQLLGVDGNDEFTVYLAPVGKLRPA